MKVKLKTYKLAFNFYLYSVALDSILVMPADYGEFHHSTEELIVPKD